MQILLDIIVPVFGVVAIGYAAARLGWLSKAGAEGLVAFVFNFAIPAMLFRAMATRAMPDPIDWGFLIAYFGGGYLVWGLGMVISRQGFRRHFDEASVAGMGAAFGNTVMLGAPLVLMTYGEAGMLPAFLIISFHSWQLIAVVTALVEGARGNRDQLSDIPGNVVRGLVANPILIGLVAGVLWNLSGLPLPAVVDGIAGMLGKAAIPCALFSMGASLAVYRITGALAESTATVTLKLALHPLAVYLLGTYVFALEPMWRDVAVLMAAMPICVNVYLFAQRYDAGTAPAATAIVISTAVSVLTVALVLHGLEVR